MALISPSAGLARRGRPCAAHQLNVLTFCQFSVQYAAKLEKVAVPFKAGVDERLTD